MGVPPLNQVLHPQKVHAGRVPEALGMAYLFQRSSELLRITAGVSKGCMNNSPETLQGKE